MIDEKELIVLIERHKKNVTCGNPFTDGVYAMAHDHIIELVEILATKGGE